jgi:cation:H+ antiporter
MIDVVFMLGVTILCFIFGKTQDKYDKKEGIILLLLFVAYMAFAIMRN